MRIFNVFLHKIYLSNNMKYFIEYPDKIKDMIHSTQEEMINYVISMYTASYSNIMDAVEMVLSNKKYYLQGYDLDNALKGALSLPQVVGYGIDEIRRVLIESGLIGKITKCSFSYVGDGTEGKYRISVDTHIRFINAKFEYQIKGRIRFNKEDYYVLHPMCYEHFECEVGLQTLVYPDDYDIDEEVRRNVRLK
jgi:hypothetical protein